MNFFEKKVPDLSRALKLFLLIFISLQSCKQKKDTVGVTIDNHSMAGSDQKFGEYKRWLEFYALEDSDFQQIGNEVERKIKWEAYDLSKAGQTLFSPFRIYSPDSAFFIDLDSYSLIIEKENGQLISYGSEVDTKVQLIRTSDEKVCTLLFCGNACFAETAYWLNGHTVELLGFSEDENGNYIPTKWRVDLNNMLFSHYRADKIFKQRPESYERAVRLQEVDFK